MPNKQDDWIDEALNEIQARRWVDEESGRPVYGTVGHDKARAKLESHLREEEAALVKKWESFCGCPMCEHHSTAYKLAPQKEGDHE